MSFPVKAYHNGDDVFLLWRPAAAIKDCRGFAIEQTWTDQRRWFADVLMVAR